MQQLTLKFGPLPQTAIDTVRGASIDQLKLLAAAVLTAGTLEEILG